MEALLISRRTLKGNVTRLDGKFQELKSLRNFFPLEEGKIDTLIKAVVQRTKEAEELLQNLRETCNEDQLDDQEEEMKAIMDRLQSLKINLEALVFVRSPSKPLQPPQDVSTHSPANSVLSHSSTIRRKRLAADLEAKLELARINDEKEEELTRISAETAKRQEEKAKRQEEIVELRRQMINAKLDEEDGLDSDLDDPDDFFKNFKKAPSVHNSTKSPSLSPSEEELFRRLMNLKSSSSPPPIPKKPGSPHISTSSVKSIPAPEKPDKMDRFLIRQTMGKDLPYFSGEPEEWPGFIDEFQRSTELCQFSPGENLNRLRKCLKGSAKDTVSAMLTAPENVDEVIKILRLNFGNPIAIIRSLIEKAKKTPPPREDKLETILSFSNCIRNLVVTIKSLKRPAYMENPSLMQEFSEKLPGNLQREWGRVVKTKERAGEHCDLSDFSSWITDEAEVICSVYVPGNSKPAKEQKKDAGPEKKSRPQTQGKVFVSSEEPKAKKTRKCSCCAKEGHFISACQDFKGLPSADRWKFVKEKDLCFGCLNFGHLFEECRSKKACPEEGCDKKHHRLLHYEKPKSPAAEVIGHFKVQEESVQPRVVLMILPVKLHGPKGDISTLAMLDTGSSTTIIDADMAETLGLKGQRVPFTYQGLHPAMTEAESNRVDFGIKSADGSAKFQIKNARTIRNIPLPAQSIRKQMLKKWKHLQPINLEYYDGQPKVLIGLDNAHLIIPTETVRGPPNAPVAAKTKLGWVLAGNADSFPTCANVHFFVDENRDELHQLVKGFFTTESFGVKVTKEEPRSKDDKRALQIMEETTTRTTKGWKTGLLWRNDDVQFPNSRYNALNRLHSMERKMDKDVEFGKFYCDKIQDYEAKGYVKKLTTKEAEVVSPRTFYLPHFVVINPHKPKPRLVFDAAAKAHGVSFNDNLLTGPDLLSPLYSVLFKFRHREFALTADIKEMFHQVEIIEEDRQSQRFLFRGLDREKTPDTYEIQVMFFGAASSPTCAQYVKNRNAEELKVEFPLAHPAILDRHYVDDYLDSADSLDEGRRLIDQVIEVHRRGGFQICGWRSNSREILDHIPEDLRATELKSLGGDEELPTGRVLGLWWDPEEDVFTWRTSFAGLRPEIVNGSVIPTKRETLRLTMSLFDPLGFLAYFTIKAKILLQEIWRTGIGWDDEIPQLQYERWREWTQELAHIPGMKIPRCYVKNQRPNSSIQLHVFCDASQQAFSAVAYFRIVRDEEVVTNLVMAKTHVAPLKPMSIPRLELQAAVMATRLATTVKEGHDLPIKSTHFWSDSRTALCWIKSDGKRYQQFVAHRIGEIQESTDASQWRWVPTKDNGADDATRDNAPCDFGPGSRWINGPQFLKLEEPEWPKERATKEAPEPEELELRKEFIGALIHSPDPVLDIKNYSSYSRLLRVTAWILRLCRRSRPKDLTLDPDELESAKEYWYQTCQRDSYFEEVRLLSSGKSLPKSSPLSNLSPFMGTDGILRIKGRLTNADVTDNVKCPVILPPKHRFTRLLVDHYHQKAGHHGMESVVNELLQLYHIPTIRIVVRSSWSSCSFVKSDELVPTLQKWDVSLLTA